MRLRNALLINLFLLIVAACCHAGTDSLPYKLKHYTSENGLPQNSVKAIAADDCGFLWLATEAGLVRFDGQKFKLFNKKNTGILSSRMITIERNIVDKKLYAISDSWSFLEIACGTANRHASPPQEFFKSVYRLPLNRTVLHRTWQSPLHKEVDYGEDSLQFNINDREAIVLLRNGRVYWYKDLKEVATIYYKPIANFASVFSYGRDLYFVQQGSAGQDLVKVSASGITRSRITGDLIATRDKGYTVLCRNNASSDLFLYRNDCLYLLEPSADGNFHVRLLLQDIQLEKKQIISGYYDRVNGQLYLGSAINGLLVYSPKQFETKTAEDKTGTLNVFYEMVAFNDSSILSGKGVLLSSGKGKAQYHTLMQKSSNAYGSTVLKARDQSIWTADLGYLYQFNEDAYRVKRKWKIPYTFSIYQGEDGMLWLGTNKKGLYQLDQKDPNAQPKLFFQNNNYIICINQESPNILWAGSEGNLFRVNLQTRKADTIAELHNKVVRGLYIPQPGEVWICTYEDGLYLYQNGRLTHFPLDFNGYLNNVHCILEDKNGFFWMTTNNGLFQVAKTDLLHYADYKEGEIFYQHYNKNDGFNTNEFNGGSLQVGVKLKNGYFAFSSMDGVVFFDPNKVKPELPNRQIIIDDIEVDGRKIRIRDSLQLKRNNERINISFATFYTGNSENLLYEYRTTHDEEKSVWLPINQSLLSFSAFPTGTTVITVRKAAGFGKNNYTYKTLVVNIPPAWWASWWFMGVALLVTAFLVWLFVRSRLYYLRKKTDNLEQVINFRTKELHTIIGMLEQSEKTLGEELTYQKRLNENIGHDISTPLKYLTLLSKKLLHKVRGQEAIVEEEMLHVYEGADRVHQLTQKLVQYMKLRTLSSGLKPEHLLLRDLLNEVTQVFTNVALARKNKIDNQIDVAIQVNVVKPLLEVVLHNLIDNAHKHTNTGTITLRARQIEAGSVLIAIEDTGSGMTEQQVQEYNAYFSGEYNQEEPLFPGFGFRTIRDVLPLLNASLALSSKEGKGSLFILVLRP